MPDSGVSPGSAGRWCESDRAVPNARRVLIVDDHPVVTEMLATLVNQQDDLEVCGVASSVAEALDIIRARTPDVAIVDISLNGTDGLELIRTAAASGCRLPMLVLSRHDEAVYGERALRAGARGYLTKQQALDRVLEALRRILDGETYFSEELKARLVRAAVEGHRDESPVDRLSDRELEVYRLLGQGLATRQIAERLHLSASTVESHRRNIRRKMDLSTSRELMLNAVQWWHRQSA